MLFPLNLYHFLNTPKDYLLKLQEKFGDPFPLSFPGAQTIWLTGKSELAKTIFSAPADSFKASEKNPVGPLLGKDGLIMQSGTSHLGARKEFVPYFSKKNLLKFAPNIQEIFKDLYDERGSSGNIHLQEFSFKATLKIILKFLFPLLSPVELREAEALTQKFLQSYSASYLFVPQWVPGTWNIFKQKKIELDNKFYDFYLSQLHLGAEGPLYELEGLTKSQILDHVRTFIVAGHETSAISLTWALYFINKDPFLKNRLREELTLFSEDTLEQSVLQNNFLDSVISEALRIHSPVPFITRKIVNRPFVLGENTYQIDDEIGVCISLLHQQSEVWQSPETFNPERFLEHKYSPYEFAPFGGGIRRCLGAELAILELKLLAANFVKNFECELIENDLPVSEVMQITIGPKKPIWLKYKKIGENKLPWA